MLVENTMIIWKIYVVFLRYSIECPWHSMKLVDCRNIIVEILSKRGMRSDSCVTCFVSTSTHHWHCEADVYVDTRKEKDKASVLRASATAKELRYRVRRSRRWKWMQFAERFKSTRNHNSTTWDPTFVFKRYSDCYFHFVSCQMDRYVTRSTRWFSDDPRSCCSHYVSFQKDVLCDQHCVFQAIFGIATSTMFCFTFLFNRSSDSNIRAVVRFVFEACVLQTLKNTSSVSLWRFHWDKCCRPDDFDFDQWQTISDDFFEQATDKTWVREESVRGLNYETLNTDFQAILDLLLDLFYSVALMRFACHKFTKSKRCSWGISHSLIDFSYYVRFFFMFYLWDRHGSRKSFMTFRNNEKKHNIIGSDAWISQHLTDKALVSKQTSSQWQDVCRQICISY